MKTIINNFSRVLCALLLCAGLVVTGCYDDTALQNQYKELDDRLDNLEEVQIKSLNDQISSINASLKNLESIDAELQELIDYLVAEVENLQAQLDDYSPSDSSAIKALEDEIADIKAFIHVLETMDMELADQIEDLMTYVENELVNAEDWANATFATLTQYAEMQSELAVIKALLNQNGGNVDVDLSAFQEAIEEAIAASEASMKAWVNELLAEGYYDIAAIDAKLAALEAKLTEDDAELAVLIVEQQAILDDVMSELEDDYMTAIEDAINSNNGVISDEIAASIAEAKAELEELIYIIASQLAEIESILSSVEQDIAEILAMIQSIAYMPSYSDGVTYVNPANKTAEMSFKISPSSAVAALEDVWSQALSVKYITTAITKAAPAIKDLSVTSAEFDKNLGTVYLMVNCANLDATFYEGSTTASAALFISDGKNNISSDFIPLNPSHIVDLSSSGTANSYIVSESGGYRFKTVVGNSSTSVGSVSSAEVLWESFGTDIAPSTGDLVKNVTYADGYISFEASGMKGNAVIAAKDADGKILWSWHIWLTDQPEEHVYNNNAGIMMDRNLGATSATPGDVSALGLFYQWGRKDPFLGSSSIHEESQKLAASTITWPSAVSSDSSTGTIDYITANPTTFVMCAKSSNDYDWHYGSRTDDLWKSEKTIYDPCPPGWRVPDGESSGVWSTALGSSSSFTDAELYNSTTEGVDFSGKFGTASTIWYPASGCLYGRDGNLIGVGCSGRCWSVTPTNLYAHHLLLNYDGVVKPMDSFYRAYGFAVRCLQVID